jgi:hypothetical protein
MKTSGISQSANGITFLPLVRYRYFQNSRVDRRIRIPWAKTTSEPRGPSSLKGYSHVIFLTFCKEFFLVDDDSGLSAIGLVR